jgi:hypothetical protein
MGAISIHVTAHGKSMRDAFKNAQAEAQEQHGSDIYNGQINNCELIKDVTNRRSDFDEDDHMYEWIIGQTNKREVYGYCIQDPVTNKNKIKTVVHNIPQKGTRKWETRYVAQARYGDDYIGISEKTQTEAIKKARAYVEKHPNASLKIVITKVLTEGETTCAKIDYKEASNERDGMYTFVGFAPE